MIDNYCICNQKQNNKKDMAKTKLETIQETIQSLKSLGMPVSYDLLLERDKEERALSDKKIQDAVDFMKTTAHKVLSGLDGTIDIEIHYKKGMGCSFTCSVQNTATTIKEELDKEFRQLNVKYSKAIIIYANGYEKCKNLLHSQIDKSAVATLDFSSEDIECLLLVSYSGYYFVIGKSLLNFQNFGRLISPPQFKHKIDNAFLCKTSDNIEVMHADGSLETLCVADFKFRNGYSFTEPIKTKEILSIRIK